MAKQEHIDQAEADAEAVKSNYLATEQMWDQTREPEFGGQSDILELNVGEIAGPLSYVGQQSMATSLGQTTVHTATTTSGNTVRLPIGATFLRAIDQAAIRRDDTFLVKRFDDVKKKTGKGAGVDMKIYAVKVLSRTVPAI